jgi:DNA-binding beta-propeller fold protein YncE
MRAAVVLSMLCASATLRAQPPARDYLVLVASESVDRVALVRFGPTGARVEREKYVGWSKMEVAGPHGVAITPSAREYFVTIAHGTPFGKLVKYDAATDTQLGSVMLGNFPATAQVSPDGALVFVVNFNLHGDMETSDVSVVAAKEMVEIARIRIDVEQSGDDFTLRLVTGNEVHCADAVARMPQPVRAVWAEGLMRRPGGREGREPREERERRGDR